MSSIFQWCIRGNRSASSHPPVVSANGSHGVELLTVVNIYPRQDIALDVFETYDPNANISRRKAIGFTNASLL